MAPRKIDGLTRMELIVALGIVGVLILLLYPSFASARLKGQLINSVSCYRQAHIATMSMANDGASEANPEKGWPGDLKARGVIHNTSDFVTLLVKWDYLRAGDLLFFCQGSGGWLTPGFKPYHGTLRSGSGCVLDPPFSEENNPFKIFLVKDADDFRTVFMATKNYTYNKALDDPRAKPFGVDGFVVGHKGGDVSIYKKENAQNLQMIGWLPGGGTVESSSNCLNP